MPSSQKQDEGSSQSGWEKAERILRASGGVLAALSVALVGYMGSNALAERQASEMDSRLYAQLMSGREESDSQLRQEMFKTIIAQFLTPPDAAALERDFEREVLKLEVLAYNFHDSLDLAPLFKDVYRNIRDLDRDEDSACFSYKSGCELECSIDEDCEPTAGCVAKRDGCLLKKRLEKVAKEVTNKQIAALEDSGSARRRTIEWEELETMGFVSKLISERLPSLESDDGELGSGFDLDVLGVDKQKREVEVRLTVYPAAEGADAKGIDATFWTGFYDFPMIDNTRLPNGERCAVVLNQFGDYTGEITLIYFPGSRAGLKEKPFYDEVMQDLRRTRRQLREAPRP